MTDHTLSVNYDGPRVLLVVDGKGVLIPWQQSDELATALVVMARKAEEQDDADRIIFDNALIQRAGMPIGFSDDPKIKDATVNTALYHRVLRRALPFWKNRRGLDRIQRRGAVGAPWLRNIPGTGR